MWRIRHADFVNLIIIIIIIIMKIIRFTDWSIQHSFYSILRIIHLPGGRGFNKNQCFVLTDASVTSPQVIFAFVMKKKTLGFKYTDNVLFDFENKKHCNAHWETAYGGFIRGSVYFQAMWWGCEVREWFLCQYDQSLQILGSIGWLWLWW